MLLDLCPGSPFSFSYQNSRQIHICVIWVVCVSKVKDTKCWVAGKNYGKNYSLHKRSKEGDHTRIASEDLKLQLTGFVVTVECLYSPNVHANILPPARPDKSKKAKVQKSLLSSTNFKSTQKNTIKKKKKKIHEKQ